MHRAATSRPYTRTNCTVRSHLWARPRRHLRPAQFDCGGNLSPPWFKSVCTKPGATAFTVMACGPSSMARGMSRGAHFVGGGLAGHRFVISHGFVRPFRKNFAFRRNFAFHRNFAFRRNFATGALWPYYGYDYFPTDAYADMDGTTYPGTVGFVPQPPPASACNRSEEMVTVPSEGGGTRQIKIIRCP